MYRVFTTFLVKSQRHITHRRMSSQTTGSGEWAERKQLLQMKYEHELTMKKLELDRKRGLEHLGVSRDTANVLTVCGTCVLVVSSGAWFVSRMVADTQANMAFFHRELSNQSENMRSFISGGN